MKKRACMLLANELKLRVREEPKCVNVLTSTGLVVYHASNRLFYRGICKNEDNFETVWEEIYEWLLKAKKENSYHKPTRYDIFDDEIIKPPRQFSYNDDDFITKKDKG